MTLTVTPGPGDWLVSGATLSSGKGATVILTAADRAGTADISVKVGTQTASVRFIIVAPNSMTMEVVQLRHSANGRPNGETQNRMYVGPDDVSFANLKTREKDALAAASGYWQGAAGQNHSPNPSPGGMTSTVVAGKGTLARLRDHCGIWGGPPGPPWAGSCVFLIPQLYSVGRGGEHEFVTLTQSMVNDAAGTLTISKGGNGHPFKLTDGESTFAGAHY